MRAARRGSVFFGRIQNKLIKCFIGGNFLRRREAEIRPGCDYVNSARARLSLSFLLRFRNRCTAGGLCELLNSALMWALSLVSGVR